MEKDVIIKELQKEHDVYFLTAKIEGQLVWTKQVLEREGLGDIPIVNSWGSSKNTHTFDILFDDSPEVIKEVGNRGVNAADFEEYRFFENEVDQAKEKTEKE